MHFVLFGDFLGLGHSTSSFGYTLALLLTWFVMMPLVGGFFVTYAVITVLAERRENQARVRAYDELHPSEFMR